MRKTVIISLLFHIGLLIAFMHFRIPLREDIKDVFVVWDVVGPAAKPDQRMAQTRRIERLKTIIADEVENSELENAVATTESAWQDTLKTAASDSLQTAMQLVYSDFYLKKNLALQPPQDSSGKKIMPMWNGLMPPLADPMVGSQDGDIGTREMARRRQTYSKPVPLTSIGSALLQKLQSRPKVVTPRLNFIPTRAELDVLMIVWPHDSITDQDVYRHLDASIKLTAEDVQRLLNGLERKGVLSSELISPRNEFTIGTPLGSSGIEMSAQNRRNRIFRYKSLIDRRHMIRFLNAVLDQVQNRRGPFVQPNTDADRLQQDLQEKLIKLVDE
jgi:predicted transcriptional regulator